MKRFEQAFVAALLGLLIGAGLFLSPAAVAGQGQNDNSQGNNNNQGQLHEDTSADLGTLASEPPNPYEWESQNTSSEDASVTPLTNKCVGDGITGNRFQVFYAYNSNKVGNFNQTTIDKIRRAIGYADAYLWQSDPTYGQLHRWLCTNGTQIDVTSLPVSDSNASGSIDYWEIANAVTAATGVTITTGGSSSSKNFVVFFYTPTGVALPYCGGAFIPGTNGTSNAGRGGMMADIRCWSGGTVLHETTHTLGAVIDGAPHASGAGHCYDTNDVMCYNDGGSYFLGPDGRAGTPDDGQLKNLCPNDPTWQMDCGHNKTGTTGSLAGEDYWDPSGGQFYLSAHWNTANSLWLKPPALK